MEHTWVDQLSSITGSLYFWLNFGAKHLWGQNIWTIWYDNVSSNLGRLIKGEFTLVSVILTIGKMSVEDIEALGGMTMYQVIDRWNWLPGASAILP